MDSTTQALNLDLLDEFPWFQGVPPHHRTVSAGAPYASMLEVAHKRIVAAEEYYCLQGATSTPSPTIPGAIGLDSIIIPGHALLQSILSNNNATASSQKVSQLMTLLLRYRLYDVLERTSSPHRPVSPGGQPFKYPIPVPGKIFYKEMVSWPGLVTRGLNALHETSYFDETVGHGGERMDGSQDDITMYLFNSLSSRVQQTVGHSIICNLECTALYLHILSQLDDFNADLPATAQDFRVFLRATMPRAGWDSFFSKLLKTQTFKLPLHMALAVSPVCLFLPTQLMFKEVNRLDLLLMWQGLGGPRPQCLEMVELKIFQALADVAFEGCAPQPRFSALFRELRAFDFNQVSPTEGGWLAADPDFSSRIATEYYTPTHPSDILFTAPTLSPPPLPVIRGGNGDPHPSSINEVHTHPPQGPTVTGDQGGSSSIPATLPDPRVSAGGLRPTPLETPLQRPKRTKKELAIVHQTVDLSVERETIVVHEMSAPTSNSLTYRASVRCFTGPESSCCCSPQFHSIRELEMFKRFWDVGMRTQPSCIPSQIVRESDAAIETWSIRHMQSSLRQADIVVTEIPSFTSRHLQFDAPSLKTIASLQRIIAAQDFSLPLTDRGVHVVLKTLLDAASASPPRIIRSGYLPVPDAPIRTPQGVSSDTMAWDATINQAWCRRLHGFPRETMRFAIVMTSSSYEDFHVAVHGFGVYLEVQVGSVWLFIGRNCDKGPPTTAECVHLQSGSGIVLRPGTPFFSLATSDSILKGSYWYASSSLSATTVSIIHDFLAPDSPSPIIDKGARIILRRLVHFYYMVYTSGLFLRNRDCDECVHTPDITTMEGLENLLSLCNLMELANILAGDDYTLDGISEPERSEIIEARRLCRKMVEWAHRHIVILNPLTQQEQSLNDDVWMPYLARHVKVIQESKAKQAKVRMGPHGNQAQVVLQVINESFGSNIQLQLHLAALDLSTTMNPMAFQGFSTWHITLRHSILPDSQGESS